jgi:alanyl-tRNA synthetase
MTHNDIRKKFISFFTSTPRNHKEIPSAPLIPENDPTVLFITAGMHPLVPYLMGEPHPLGKRLVDIQKSFRTDDIEEVGDLRHNTFFEMLGNWSLGDYFKNEAITWSFEFLTNKKWLGLDPHKIYVSVFAGDSDCPMDQESIKTWQEVFSKAGIKAELGKSTEGVKENARIFPYPKKKNWWGPAGTTGPCGPDSEMFYDTGLPLHDKKIYPEACHINCDCGRYVEIWNDVFMQYNKKSDGTYEPLTQQNVDTGMGMERTTAILEWLSGQIALPDPFDTQLFSNARKKLEELTRKSYEEPYKRSMRIILDHVRAATFVIADGVEPGNKERGYVLRRLIRRTIRHGNLLDVTVDFTGLLAEDVIATYKDFYPELISNKEKISSTLAAEETRFRKTLSRGLREIEKYPLLNGKIAFDLYQSFGFPWEMTAEIAREKGQKIDKKQFADEFAKHQDASRTATRGIFKGGLQDHSEETTKLHTATHLLQQALRTVLGPHVRQRGSHITAERLRFDFTHTSKLSDEEIKKIEVLINAQIRKNLKVTMDIMTLPEALKAGALTVPGTLYPKKVKVYRVANFSKEVCGGPHADFTGSLGTFKIIKEEAAGQETRRIYATLNN